MFGIGIVKRELCSMLFVMKLIITFLDEDGEAEVDGLERRVVGGAGEQEVLGLEVAVRDPHEVADVDDGEDVAADGGVLAL